MDITVRLTRQAALAAASLALATGAQAQLFRAYVSSTGSDMAACTIVAPCRLLPAALGAVASGGEIWMLDSANYNTSTVNVTKSVTILAVPGAVGSVVANGATALNVATPGVRLVLKNVVLKRMPGTGAGQGIYMVNGDEAILDHCLVSDMQGYGVYVQGNGIKVRVTESTFRDNSYGGIAIAQGARATVSRSMFVNNGTYGGFYASGDFGATTTVADISDSTFSGNTAGVVAWSRDATGNVSVSVRGSGLYESLDSGIFVESDYGAPVQVAATTNVLSNNLNGVRVINSGAKAWIGGNTVTGNSTGLNIAGGGSVESAGDTVIRDNATNVSGSISSTPGRI